MTLGAWIFLSVVLVMVVLNKPFRKFFFWAAAISAVGCGLFFAYLRVKDWREQKELQRKAAIEQKKQGDCISRLNARIPAKSDNASEVIQKIANAETCRQNPDVYVTIATPEGYTIDPQPQQAAPGAKLPSGPRGNAPDTLPADFFAQTHQAAQPKAIEGTITNDAVVYSESLPSGPGGRLLGKVQKGTRVRVVQLHGIYQNVFIKTPNGISGWVSSGEVEY